MSFVSGVRCRGPWAAGSPLPSGDGPPKHGPKPYAAATEGAIQKIAQGCAKHKVVCGIAAGGGKEYREQLVKWGYRMFLN